MRGMSWAALPQLTGLSNGIKNLKHQGVKSGFCIFEPTSPFCIILAQTAHRKQAAGAVPARMRGGDVHHTPNSQPSPDAPDYHKATQVLNFHIESGGKNHWSTQSTMQSYVQNILVPYFEGHRQDNNQICIWQIDCWSVHQSAEFRDWIYDTYPWIQIHYVPTNCTGLFQPCDVGIQQVLKLAIRRSALQDIINDTTEQLGHGVEPTMVTFEKWLPVVQDHSIQWLVNGYEAINNPELIKKVISKNIHSFPYPPHIILGFPALFYWGKGLQPLIWELGK